MILSHSRLSACPYSQELYGYQNYRPLPFYVDKLKGKKIWRSGLVRIITWYVYRYCLMSNCLQSQTFRKNGSMLPLPLYYCYHSVKVWKLDNPLIDRLSKIVNAFKLCETLSSLSRMMYPFSLALNHERSWFGYWLLVATYTCALRGCNTFIFHRDKTLFPAVPNNLWNFPDMQTAHGISILVSFTYSPLCLCQTNLLLILSFT